MAEHAVTYLYHPRCHPQSSWPPGYQTGEPKTCESEERDAFGDAVASPQSHKSLASWEDQTKCLIPIKAHHYVNVLHGLPSWTLLSMRTSYYPIAVYVVNKFSTSNTLKVKSSFKYQRVWNYNAQAYNITKSPQVARGYNMQHASNTCCPLPEPYLTSWEWRRIFDSALASFRTEAHVTYWNPMV